MGSGIGRVWVLLTAVALLSIGHGLHGSLIGVRATVEQFNQTTTGLVMAGYSAGLLVSSWATPRMIQTVGHIRVFAGFASVVSTAVLLVPLWIEPAWWFAMRFITGLCTAGLFIVCESWLNSASTNENRGKILSLYMMVTYGAVGVGQVLLNISDESGFSRFILVSAIMSFALVLDMLSPLAVCRPEVKKYFISKMPCGVCMYLPETPRLTVVSCTPTTSATCTIVSGFKWATPFSMKSR